MSPTVDDYWRAVVTTALLGTDRRDPPPPPSGPVADAIADALGDDPGRRLLTAVAVVTAARRAGFEPLPPTAPLQAPDADPRPLCPAPAAATWRQVVADWPVLEDEWLSVVSSEGWRLPPDVLAEALSRHRRSPERARLVVAAGGPAAGWVVDHVPGLEMPSVSLGDDRTGLPELPMPADLAELLPADAHTFVAHLVTGFESDEFGPAHRAVLVNLLARCRREVLVDAAEALSVVASGLALALADLARLRHRMLDELRRH